MKEKPDKTIQSAKDFFQKTADRAKQKQTPSFFKNMTAAFAILWEKVKLFLKSGADFTPPAKEKIVSFVLKWWHWLLGGVFAFIVLYYPAGALLYHRIDLNPRFAAADRDGRIQSLDTLAELIGREVDKHAFTPNLPFFFPAAVLDNMPAFQTGIIDGAQKVAAVFADVNPQAESLKEAAERLAYPASVWHVDAWKPAVSSVKKYRTARHLILEYETQAREGRQTFNTSPDAFKTIAGALAQNLKECVRKIGRQVAGGEKKVLDTQADDVFYNVKGQSYVYFLTLRDMETDFKDLFANEALKNKWEKALSSLKKAVQLQPMIVINGAAETQFFPNHLLGLGFYLAQAAIDLTDMAQTVRQAENE